MSRKIGESDVVLTRNWIFELFSSFTSFLTPFYFTKNMIHGPLPLSKNAKNHQKITTHGPLPLWKLSFFSKNTTLGVTKMQKNHKKDDPYCPIFSFFFRKFSRLTIKGDKIPNTKHIWTMRKNLPTAIGL